MLSQIAQFLSYAPRNKVAFIPREDPHLKTIDVGFELSNCIKNDLTSPYLPMVAEEALKKLFAENLSNNEIIGDYIALSNWGILFEPALQLNLLSLFEANSKSNTLILVNCGVADSDTFHLVSKHFNTQFPLGQLLPYVIK